MSCPKCQGFIAILHPQTDYESVSCLNCGAYFFPPVDDLTLPMTRAVNRCPCGQEARPHYSECQKCLGKRISEGQKRRKTRMPILVTLTLLLLCLVPTVHAVTFPFEHVHGFQSAPPYGWSYNYDIGFVNNTLTVDLDIHLVGATPTDTLLGRWEHGIEDTWSTTRFEVPIQFDVQWVTSNADYTVNIIDGSGRWDMLDWYTVGAAGWGDPYQEKAAAHEAGHMVSLFDEYAGGAVDPNTHLINTGGLMATLRGGTLDYYYHPFLSWYETKLAGGITQGSDIVITPTEFPQRDSVTVPEVGTWMLVGMGLLVLAAAHAIPGWFTRTL